MKTYEYIIKVEGLESSKIVSVSYNGTLKAENIKKASEEVLNFIELMHGKFRKFHLTLEEKLGHT